MGLNREQKKALNLMMSGKNVFLTGKAGTGKSYVVNQFMKKTTKNVIITAPTGIAAINVGGVTLHRALKVPVRILEPDACNRTPNKVLEKADVVIIDEISMCRIDLFQYVINTIQYNEEHFDKHIQLIVVGDFLQLPPVVTDEDAPILHELYGDIGYGFAFQSPRWAECNFESVILEDVVRQSQLEFVTNLNKARIGDADCIEFFNDNLLHNQVDKGIHICGTNKEVKNINENELKKFNHLISFIGQKQGRIAPTDMVVDERIRLGVGVRVMSVINDRNNQYQNGSLGTVTKVRPLTVEFDNGNVCNIEPYTWDVTEYVWDAKLKKLRQQTVGSFKQIPLKLAYAITIHKSQGQTYDSGILDPQSFAPGQLYVGLSRVTTMEQLQLKRPIEEEFLITSSEVIAFYENIANRQSVDYVTQLTSTIEDTKLEAINDVIDCVTKSNSHGGARENSGRKCRYVCDTKTIRVPVLAIAEIMEIIKKYEKD